MQEAKSTPVVAAEDLQRVLAQAKAGETMTVDEALTICEKDYPTDVGELDSAAYVLAREVRRLQAEVTRLTGPRADEEQYNGY